MKKLLCLLLSMVLLFSLVACGNNEKDNQNNQNSQTDDMPNDDITLEEDAVPDIEKFGAVWELREIAPTTIELTTKETEVNGVKIISATTAFAPFNMEEMTNKLKDNTWFSGVYNDSIYNHKKEDHSISTYETNFGDTTITDTYVIEGTGRNLESMHIFEMELSQMRHIYQAPNSMHISFEINDISKVNQTEIYNILKDITPELAEFMVYGKDINADDGGEQLNSYSMWERIPANNGGAYMVERTISYSSAVDNAKIHFEILDYTNHDVEYSNGTLKDETDFYKESEYSISALFADESKVLTPSNYKDFTNMFVKDLIPNYNRAAISHWQHQDYRSPAGGGLTEHRIDIELQDVSNSSIGFADFRTVCGFIDNEMYFQHVNIAIKSNEEISKNQKATLEKFINQFSELFGNFNAEKIVLQDGYTDRYCAEVTATIDGRKYTGKIEIKPENGTWINLDMSFSD